MVNKAAVNVECTGLYSRAWNFLDTCPRVKDPSHMVVLFLSFWTISKLISTTALYWSPYEQWLRVPSSARLLEHLIIRFLDNYSYFDDAVSHSSLKLYFLVVKDIHTFESSFCHFCFFFFLNLSIQGFLPIGWSPVAFA